MNLLVLPMFFFYNLLIGTLRQVKERKYIIDIIEMVKLRVFEQKRRVFGIRKIHVGNVFISIDRVCPWLLLLNRHLLVHRCKPAHDDDQCLMDSH